MSEPKLISPMLDNFEIGGPISDHNGVRCCPAMRKNTDEKYIVKIISVPASQTKLDALLLTGAYPDKASALVYFKDVADGIIEEKKILDDLAQLEGFLPYEDAQIVPMEDGNGFDVYLLSPYRKTLERQLNRTAMTQLGAVNLGLDICAGLAVCRRSGYMFVDLKPANIYVTAEKEYRIGDLGFVRLNGLKYASLPDKYRNSYTAPEVEDAFAALSDTMDIYAAGLILYQIFNGGTLPFSGDLAPAETFAPPVYADEEMAQIILKACHPDPAQRWQDPIQMGQAIVSYMQKNGVNDTPLTAEFFGEETTEESVPIPNPAADVDTDEDADNGIYVQEVSADGEPDIQSEPEEAPVLGAEDTEEPAPMELVDDPDTNEEAVQCPECDEEPASETVPEEPEELIIPHELPVQPEGNLEVAPEDDSEEEYDNLSFLDEMMEGIDLTTDADLEDYSGITDEVSDILDQVDALAALQVPDPVIAPEPIDVKLPDPPETAEDAPEEASEATSEDAESDTEEVSTEEVEADTQDESAKEEQDEDDYEEDEEELPYIPRKRRTGLVWTIVILLLLALAAGGYYFYTQIYLQPIHTLELSGSEDSLEVSLKADIDESLLSVVCADPHGNNIPAPVVNGKAVFTGLNPDTAYTVSVQVSGFHELTGTTTKVYSTPIQTQIAQINVVTGSEDGSVILSFSVEGPDSQQWNVIYSAEGEAERVTTFPAHMVTLAGLTVGKEYTFRLEPVDDIYLSGENQTTYVARTLVAAENLHITACADGVLTAQWDAPEDAAITKWTVRCYSEDNTYDQTITTDDTVAIFENIDDSLGFIVEVTAESMSVNQRTQINSNSVTISDFKIIADEAKKLNLSWKASRDIPEGGWMLHYSVNGIGAAVPITTGENAAEVPIVPGGNYVFELYDTQGNSVLGGPFIHAQAAASGLDAFSVKKSDLNLRLCKTPTASSWSYKDLKDDDYANTFSAGQKVSVVISSSADVSSSSSKVLTSFVIYDEDNNLVTFSHTSKTWKSMWYENYCELDIPGIPAEVGTYTVYVYFNGEEAGSQKFMITA